MEFKRADEIALSVGIEADSGKRLFGAASHVLRHNLKNGHTCLARQTVVQLVMRLTGVEEAAIEADIDQRIEEEELFSVRKTGSSFSSLQCITPSGISRCGCR